MINSEIISKVWNEGTCGICACTWLRHDYDGYASFACFKEFASQCLEAKDKELAQELWGIMMLALHKKQGTHEYNDLLLAISTLHVSLTKPETLTVEDKKLLESLAGNEGE